MNAELMPALSPEDRSEVQRTASSALETARAYRCTTAVEYEAGADMLKALKGAAKILEGKKQTVLNPLNNAIKALRNLFTAPEAQLDEAERLIKRQLLSYADEQERIRKEAQRKLDDAAAEERRKKAEQEERARKAADEARAAGKEAQAEKLERKADLLADTAATVVAPIVQVETPRVAGLATRENWYAVVIDKKALLKGILDGTVPDLAFEPNMKFLNAQAKVMKKALPYPGVQACMDKVLASGSK